MLTQEQLDDLRKHAADLKLDPIEWVAILRVYKTETRLRLLLPLLALRCPEKKLTHAELAVLVGSSREKTTRALGMLRLEGVYRDELSVRRRHA